MKNILLYLIAGSRGGETRQRILMSLSVHPKNAHQLTKELMLDYKTVQHHLRVLEKHRVLATINKGAYGAAYYIPPEIEAIWAEFGKKYLNAKKQR